MCANFRPASREDIGAFLGRQVGLEYGAEAFPGSPVPMLRLTPEGMEVELATFGLVPRWVKDRKGARTSMRRCYNARHETAATKPSFRAAFKDAWFAVIPAAAVFEPNYETGSAVRWRIEPAGDEPLFIGGLYERWTDPETGDDSLSCSMLTLSAQGHPLLSRFHGPEDEKRTVTMLRASEVEAFLHAPPGEVLSFCKAWPAERLRAEADPLPPRNRSGKRQGG